MVDGDDRTSSGVGAPAGVSIVFDDDVFEPEEPPRQRQPVDRRNLLVAAGVTILTLLVAFVVVLLVAGDDDEPRPDVTLSSADPRRLPSDVPELWSVGILGTGGAKSTEVYVHERDVVVAIVDDGSLARSSIHALEVDDGERRWRRSFLYAPEQLRILGVIDGAIVTAQADVAGSLVFALDVVTGETLWERRADGSLVHTILSGTDVVTQLPAEGRGPITFIDPRGGGDLGAVDGSLASTDLDGGWYVWTDDGLAVIRLDAGRGSSIEPQIVAPPSATSADVVRVDAQTVTIGPTGDLSIVEVDEPERTIDVASRNALGAGALVPVGGERFVVVAGSELLGLRLDGAAARIVWSRDAEFVTAASTEGGVVVLAQNPDVETGRLDDEYYLLDGLTGDELSRINVPRNDPVEPIIVGDGFVRRAMVAAGDELAAFDLDGAAGWTLATTGRVALGDRLVASLGPADDGYVVTLYGDAE